MYTYPLVSIITPSYNTSKVIKAAVESILKQTYSNWELIIVDDCSSDNSMEILMPYMEKDSRIKVMTNKTNLGAAHSRNKAIKQSNGEYIAFLDSDDLWLPAKLEKQIALMKKENCYMCYTAYTIIDILGNEVAHHPVHTKTSYADLLKRPSMIGMLTMIYNAKKLGKLYFDKIGHEDYILKLHILKHIGYAVGINEPLARYRIHKGSLSSNKIQASKWVWDIYRKIQKLPLHKSMFYFLHYVYFSFTKYKKL